MKRLGFQAFFLDVVRFWCGVEAEETYPGDGKADNFQYSPYKDIRDDFKDFSVPFIFSEFGCNLGIFKTKCPYPGGSHRSQKDFGISVQMGEHGLT